MKYNVLVRIPTMLEVEASSEEEAKEILLRQLISSKQIKPADYVEFVVAQECNINNV